MKLNNYQNKNISITEHLSLINKKYSHIKPNIELLFNVTISKKEHNGFSLIFNPSKLITKEYVIDQLKKDKSSFICINAFVFKDMFSTNFIEYGFPEILTFQSDNVFNDNNDKFKLDKKYILDSFSSTGLNFDTSILYINYLNKKTINHFSSILITETKVFYFLKRKSLEVVFLQDL